MRLKNASILIVIGLITFTGCVMPARLTQEPPPLSTLHAQILQTLTPVSLSETEMPSMSETAPTAPTETKTQSQVKQDVYLHPGLPESFVESLSLDNYQILDTSQNSVAGIQLGPINGNEDRKQEIIWTYTLVAPFFTLNDGISFDSLQSLWQGQAVQDTPFTQIYVTQSTHSAMTELLGTPASANVKTVSDEVIKDKALGDEPVLGILPFENLIPQFKVMRVNGISPLDSNFNPSNYRLSVSIWVEEPWPGEVPNLPAANYDPGQRTILVMTGVTALTRATAYQMAVRGETFPAKDIRDWLLDADLTHISHEVAFTESCPYPDPVQQDLIFCASPERIALFEDIDADIIELTGNHLLDYGEAAASLTIQMYLDRGWDIYAGGQNLSEAQSPLRISHNGNNLAFMGCNLPGPPNVWATSTTAGAAPCGDFRWMEAAIQQSTADGYLPIVTLQYNEDYSAIPSSQMENDFLRLSEAGAVVVNGSQAHTPKIMGFHRNNFMHFGLGNLFFDQMEVYYYNTLMEGTRDEFIDRLVFYDNQLVSIELLTAKLEDYARPRPMTSIERETLLSRIFDLASEYQSERVP